MSDQLTSRIVCELMRDITSASIHVAKLCDMANDHADDFESRDALCGAASTIGRQIGLLSSLVKQAHTFDAARIDTDALFWMASPGAKEAVGEAVREHRTNGKAEALAMAKGSTPNAATQAPASPVEPYIFDLNCHVMPLLAAISWVGTASEMISEVQSLAEYQPELKELLRGITRPDPINAGEIVSSLAWIAENMLDYSQRVDEVHTSG